MTLNQRIMQSLPILGLVVASVAIGFWARASSLTRSRIDYLRPKDCTTRLNTSTGDIDWTKKSKPFTPTSEPNVSLVLYSAKSAHSGDVADLRNGKLIGAIANEGSGDSKLFKLASKQTGCVWFVIEPGTYPLGSEVLTMKVQHKDGEKGGISMKGVVCTHAVGDEVPEWDKEALNCTATAGLAIRADSSGVHFPSFLDEDAETPKGSEVVLAQVDAIKGPWLPCASNGCCRGY